MLEVLVSMLLLCIVLVGLTALQLTTIRQNVSSQRSAEAARLAQSRIENFQTPTPLPLATGANTSWHTALNKNGVGMQNIAADGLTTPGPYTVWERSEADAATSQTVFSVRITWLDVMRNNNTDNTMQYDTRELIISTKR